WPASGTQHRDEAFFKKRGSIMYCIRRQLVLGIMAATLAGTTAASARAQSGPSGPSGSPPAAGAPAPQPNRTVFTRASLPRILRQIGSPVPEKAVGNGGVYWQIVTQSENWSFTVQVLPMGNQDKITSLLLSSDLGRKLSPQTGAQGLLQLMQWNHERGYLDYFAYNAQTGCVTAQRPYLFPDATPDELRSHFEGFFKVIRETYTLWSPLSGGAAAPAANANPGPGSPGPGNAGQMPGNAGQVPQQPGAVNANSIAGTTWTGNENLPGFGKLTFVFRAGGAVTMIDAKGETPGSWTQNGGQVTITFDGCVYQGRINGQTLSGSGRLAQGQTWTFQVTLQKS